MRVAAERNPAATRARILETARDLFYEQGVHAVGVNEIAARAHASKLSMYRYFPSKDNLVESMLSEHSDRIHAWLERKTADAPPGPERVMSIFDLLITWFAQPGYRGCAVVNTVTDTRADPEIVGVSAIARRHLVRYRELLAQRLAGLDVEEPERVARQLLLLIEGASVVASIDRDPTAGHDARAAALLLLAGATPAAADQA